MNKSKLNVNKFYKPAGYLALTDNAKSEICNGCGAGNAKFDFVPDTIYGLSIAEACNIHDWMYHVGLTQEDKEKADKRFLENVLFLINSKGGWLRWLRERRALKYYKAVQLWGDSAYWSGKDNAPVKEKVYGSENEEYL